MLTSLEPLPFPTNHFDFVRGVRLSFHVPEDEVYDIKYTYISYIECELSSGRIRSGGWDLLVRNAGSLY